MCTYNKYDSGNHIGDGNSRDGTQIFQTLRVLWILRNIWREKKINYFRPTTIVFIDGDAYGIFFVVTICIVISDFSIEPQKVENHFRNILHDVSHRLVYSDEIYFEWYLIIYNTKGHVILCMHS